MESNYEKPLWHYSMQEFLDIQKQELEASFKGMVAEAVQEIKVEHTAPLEDVIGIAEVAKLTGLRESSIYSKVSRLQIPSSTRGRPLIFSRAEIQQWIKLGKPSVTDMAIMRRKGEL